MIPPGCAVRIDYDPDRGVSSLTLRAYREGAWVASVHVSPRVARRNEQLQQVIDVLTERGARGRDLAVRLRSERESDGRAARLAVGDVEAEFLWPPDDQATVAFTVVEPLPELAVASPVSAPPVMAPPISAPTVSTSADSASWSIASRADAPSSEVYAWRAELGALDVMDEPRVPRASAGNVVVQLPNGTALVLPGAGAAKPADLLDRTAVTTAQIAHVVRRHAEDLLAAAEQVRLATMAAIPGLDGSAREFLFRAVQLVSRVSRA